MRAKDVMSTHVVTLDPEDDVAIAAKALLDTGVSAAPVVDRDGHVCGIVSEGDLMRRVDYGNNRCWWLALLADGTTRFNRSMGTRVCDVMTREVVSVGEEATLAEVAHLLERKRIKRVPVLRQGNLLGIVSRADLLRGVAAAGNYPPGSPTTDDREIRTSILELIDRETGVSLDAISVIALNGVVYLWGVAQSPTERDAIRIAAENIVGKPKVHDNMSTLQDVLRGV